MLLFFDHLLLADTKAFSFSRDESKHLAKVLRQKSGNPITLTNGKGLEWRGELTHVSPNSATALKIESVQHSPPDKKIHLAITPTKNNSRMEWLVEKLTELGVASITPLLCEHSERKVIKSLRLEKIAVAAIKQSQQFFLPQIHPLIPFSEFIQRKNQIGFLAHCKDTPKSNLIDCDLSQNAITLLIGPEGDFSSQEIQSAEQLGFTSVSIGSKRFRTETAGLFASHIAFLKQQNN